MGWIRAPKKRTRRKLLWLIGLMAVLLVLEEIPRVLFGAAVGYDFDTHPLGPLYNLLVGIFNVFVVVLVLLGERIRRQLPRLYTAMAAMLLFTVWSALWLTLIERDSLFGFQLTMWHMMLGRFGTALLIVYTLQHLLLWWPGATKRQRRLGGLLTFGVAVAFGFGLLFTVLGGPELLGFLTVHRYLSWIVLVALVWHIIVARSTGTVASDETRRQRLSFSKRQIRVAMVASFLFFLPPLALAKHWVVAPQFLGMIFQFIESTPTDLPTYEPLPDDYARPFGDGAFLPTRATLDTGDAVTETRHMLTASGCAYEGCHTDIGKAWAVSAHRNARNVFVERVMEALERERGVEATRYCAGCHDPVNLLTGQIRPDGEPELGVTNEGVSCIVCHTIDDVTDEPGNASYRLARTPQFFERFVHRSRYIQTVIYLDDHKADFKRPALQQSVEYCGSCHKHVLDPRIGPAELLLSDKVAEWSESPYADPASETGVKTCIDCHMPEVVESYQQILVRSHRFLSSNTGVPAYYAEVVERGEDREGPIEAEQSYGAGGFGPDEIEQRAWDYDLYGRRYHRGIAAAEFTHAEQAVLEGQHVAADVIRGSVEWGVPEGAAPGESGFVVALQNAGVGHSFPAGPHDLSEVWLDVTVRDAGGETLWRSGALDENGRLDPAAERLGSDWFDADGEPLLRHEMWRLAEIRNERRIASGETLRIPVRFAAPADAPRPLEATVRLRHRRFRPDFVEWALGDDAAGFALPITDVLSVRSTEPS